MRKITRRIKREKEREKREQLNDANPPSGQFINRRRRRVLLLWQKSNLISQTSSSWGKNTLCFVFKRTERENKEEEKRDDKERGNICGDESKKELLVLVPFQERERERESLPLEFNSFLCASKRRRFCVPSRTAISNASTLLLKNGLRPI